MLLSIKAFVQRRKDGTVGLSISQRSHQPAVILSQHYSGITTYITLIQPYPKYLL